MSGNRLALLPLGARGWYPCAACAYCGNREGLRPQIMLTFARALVCADTVTCERRRYQRRAA